MLTGTNYPTPTTPPTKSSTATRKARSPAAPPISAGATASTYDLNGNLTAVSETFATNKNRTFVYRPVRQHPEETENGKTQSYFYANGKPLGSSGALSGADFDYNYTPVSDQFPAACRAATWSVPATRCAALRSPLATPSSGT